jgi:hypothetical protein
MDFIEFSKANPIKVRLQVIQKINIEDESQKYTSS